MKLPIFLLTAFALATATHLPAADVQSADALWQKVDDAMSAMKQRPATAPKTREEAMERFKKLVEATDAAGKAFVDKFPSDGRRWKFKMFEAMTSTFRPQIGLPEKGDMKALLAEIAGAPDADTDTKSEASAIRVLEAGSELERGTGTSEAWLKQAEEHLKAFPDCKRNQVIKTQMAKLKS